MLSDVLPWLAARNGQAGHLALLRQLACGVAFGIEHHAVISSGSTDAIADAPIPMGAVRARRYDVNLVDQIAREAAAGKIVPTRSKVAAMIQRMRKAGTLRISPTAANMSHQGRVSRYYGAAKELCGESWKGPVSLSMDGTRLGFKEVLWGALWLPSTETAMWCTPQVCHFRHYSSHQNNVSSVCSCVLLF